MVETWTVQVAQQVVQEQVPSSPTGAVVATALGECCVCVWAGGACFANIKSGVRGVSGWCECV